MGLLKVVVPGMLGTMLVLPLAASALLTPAARLERGTAFTPAAGSASLLKDASFSAPVGAADQANPLTPQQNVFPAAVTKFGTILAAALLVLPFGLSTLRILRRNRPA